MFRLYPQITIGDLTFRTVTDVLIESSWQNFTDKAIITLPENIQKDGQTITVGENGIFKRGQRVEIRYGYYPNADLRFVGYVSAVNPETPIVIECEDAAWLLKQGQVKLSFKSVTLKELIDTSLDQIKSTIDSDLLPEIESIGLNIIDAKLGSFRTRNGSVNFVGILQLLKRTYGLSCFFQDGNLFVGAPYSFDGREITTHEIIFERNVVAKNLTWVDEAEVRLKIKVISMLPDNSKLEYEAGDPEGDQRTFFVYNITEESELQEIAERELDKFKYTGFRGSITTFGEPTIKHGDRIDLINKKLPERNGTYQVDAVTTAAGFNAPGIRQTVKLGPRI